MRPRVFVLASFVDSLLDFRGALINEFTSRDMEVHVAAPGLGDGALVRKRLHEMGVYTYDWSLHRTGMYPRDELRAIWSVYRLFKQVRPDILLAYTAKPVIYGILSAWIARVPHRIALITGVGFALMKSEPSSLSRIITLGYRAALKRAETVIFQNPDDREFFRKHRLVGHAASTALVNGSGVDIDHFQPTVVPDGAIRFLMIARLLVSKGVREYVEAARIIGSRHPEVSFRLAGWIDEGPDAIEETELEAWQKDGVVTYRGRLEDVRPELRDCSVYVLPSYREGTPRTVLEAMATARPVITTDVPGCRETVVNGENGFLVEARSVTALADAMERFIDSPHLVSQMGKRSREIAEEKYDVTKVNAVMLRAIGIDY